MSARRLPWWWRKRAGWRRTRPIWSRSNTRKCRRWSIRATREKPGAPQVHPEAPGNLARRLARHGRRAPTTSARSTRSSRARRMSRASPCCNQRLVVASMETRGATGVYDAKTEATRCTACSQSAGGHAQPGRAVHGRLTQRKAAGDHRRRRRRLRHEDAGLSGISGAPGGREENSAGRCTGSRRARKPS